MIEELEQIAKLHPKWSCKILVVDDNSPDQTAEIVKRYQTKYKNISLLKKNKEGLGKALILGYTFSLKKLKADVIIPNDADFQWDPNDYPKLMKKIEEGYDVVVASRHTKGGRVI